MVKEFLTILIVIFLAVFVSILKGSYDSKVPLITPPQAPLYIIQEHKEPIHYFFKSREFRDEYYELTTSG